MALIADRIRTNLRNAAAAARLHPLGAAIPLVVLAAGAILYALFVTVSIRIGPLSPAAAPAPQGVSAAPAPRADRTSPAGPGGVGPASVSRLAGGGPANSSRRSAGATPGRVTGARPGPSSARSPSPGPIVSPSRPGHPSPPPSPGSPAPSPSPSPTSSHGGVCLNVGLFGICLNA
jgi:hypothetical protein